MGLKHRYHLQKMNASLETRRGFTVLELLVVIAIIGALVAMILPAIMAAREAARRATCSNNLHQMVTAVHQFHDRVGYLPLAWRPIANDPQFAYGWVTQILPDLELGELARRLEPQARPQQPESLASGVFPLARCPSDISEPAFELWDAGAAPPTVRPASAAPSPQPPSVARLLISLPTSNYQGVFGTIEADEVGQPAPTGAPIVGDGAIVHDQRVRWEHLERGLSNTLLIGERTMAMVPSTWLGVDFRGDDAACRLVGSAITSPNCTECDECEFSSRHNGGAIFAWADGRVSLLDEEIETTLYQQLSKRAAP